MDKDEALDLALDAGEISRLWKRHTNPDGPHHNPHDDDGFGFARAVLAAAQPAPCTWTKSNDPHMPDTFDAACGVVWTFTDGGPVENGVRFCPGCRAAVNVAAPEPEEDLYDLAVKADNGGQP
jgi:hypothetical protein